MAADLHGPTLKIYREILEQLVELKDLYADAADTNDDGKEDEEAEVQQDVFDVIMEAATESGFEEEEAARIFRPIAAFAKKVYEA